MRLSGFLLPLLALGGEAAGKLRTRLQRRSNGRPDALLKKYIIEVDQVSQRERPLQTKMVTSKLTRILGGRPK